MQVIRGGRTIKVSIYDIVVGDVVPLKIGDQVGAFCHWVSFLAFAFRCACFKLLLLCFTQVPADGILISGHSLAIDESSMTGESKIVSLYLSEMQLSKDSDLIVF